MTAISISESSAARTRLKLTIRGRRVVGALLLAPLALGLGAGVAQIPAAFAANAGVPGTYETFATHVVLPGETLWQIAASIAGEHDVRDVVAEIMRLNAMSSASLQAGQQLALPNL